MEKGEKNIYWTLPGGTPRLMMSKMAASGTYKTVRLPGQPGGHFFMC